MTEHMTTQDIIDALYKYYRVRGYLCLHELKPGTGNMSLYGGIDFWAMHQWPSEDHTRISIEIKISKGDYAKEKAKPDKQRYALLYSNVFYYATPPKLIDPWTMRAEAGLIEVRPDGMLQIVRPAPVRDSMPPSWNFMAAVMRRLEALRNEAEMRALLHTATARSEV